MIYFDNSATTKVFDSVAETITEYMIQHYFNPSAKYAQGVHIKKEIENHRQTLANLLQCNTKEIFFTSGGTESNNSALLGFAEKSRKKMTILTALSEHSSVYETIKKLENMGHTVQYLKHNSAGQVAEDDFKKQLSTEVDLISIMHVNNETGAVNNIKKLAEQAKAVAPHCFFHSDGVQAFCKVPFSANGSLVDAYSISGHKFHGPKGVGALYLSANTAVPALILGGGQEDGRRSGTENVPGIIGMVKAAEKYHDEKQAILENIKNVKMAFYENIKHLEGVHLNGPAIEDGAPHILSIAFENIQAETLLHALSEEDICVATGSACTSYKKKKSRVLEASGVNEHLTTGTIRFSFGYYNTVQEAKEAASIIEESLRRLRKFVRR